MSQQLATDEFGHTLHQPVMAVEISELFSQPLARQSAVFVDCTLGMAGHASRLLAENPNARLIGIDRDAQALEIAGKQLAPFANRVELVQARFDELANIVNEPLAGILADLGLSSLQIDRKERGFSYSVDAALDMRMNSGDQITAADILNSYSVEDLARILRIYGEQPNAKRIAKAIVDYRDKQPLYRSSQLVDVIIKALPSGMQYRGGHPAKRVFQALRIEVNGELEALNNLLDQALELLDVGGRLAVLSYHSLEDRMVKQRFAAAASDDVPTKLPVVPENRKAQFQLLTKGAAKPSQAEIDQNRRAASARLRAIQRTRKQAS